MIPHQTHFGREFYQDKKTGYWISVDYPRIRAHRWVWIQTHYNIPEGCHIHHKNEDKSDNSIGNLELMACSDHLRLHMTAERREYSSKRMDEIRPLTKEWHASEEGRAWHKLHALKSSFGKWESKTYECQVCKKSYQTTKMSNTKFCTNACKSKFRRNSGVDDIEKICKHCQFKFKSNKYAKSIFCSKTCSLTHLNKPNLQ